MSDSDFAKGLFLGIFGVAVLVLILMVLGHPNISEHNTKFFCDSHDLEVFDYKLDGYMLQEIRCIEYSEEIKKFVFDGE